MNITLGIFKKVFAEFGSQLVAQMTTGTLTFNYKKINTDNTDYVSANNVYAKKEGVYPEGDYIQTVVWIDPVSGVTVQTGYAFGRVYGSPPSGTLPLEISTRDINAFVLVGDKYVARLPKIHANLDYGEFIGGVHIQTIDAIEYLVCYGFKLASNECTIDKYRVVLDLNIDQSLIAPMPIDKSTTFPDPVGSADSFDLFTNIINELGSDVHGTPFIEQASYFVAQNRNIVCNADGTKMAFFGSRSRSGSSKHYVVFELTDTELDFSIAEIEELDMTDEVTGTNSYTDNPLYPITSVTDTVSAPGDYTQPQPINNSINNPGNIASGSYSGTRTYEKTRLKTFLGVAYNRYTDELITAHVSQGPKRTRKIISGEYIGSDIDALRPWTMSLDFDGWGVDYEIIVNTNSTQFKVDSAYNYFYTAVNEIAGNCTLYKYHMTDFKMNVIDLSCLVFIVEYSTELENNWNFSSGIEGTIDKVLGTYESVINNGIETILNEDVTPSTVTSTAIRPYFSGLSQCVSGCIIEGEPGQGIPTQQTIEYQFDSHTEN